MKNWRDWFEFLKSELEGTGTAVRDKDLQVICVLLQNRDTDQKMDTYEKALEAIANMQHQRDRDEEPCETCWAMKSKAKTMLSRWK